MYNTAAHAHTAARTYRGTALPKQTLYTYVQQHPQLPVLVRLPQQREQQLVRIESSSWSPLTQSPTACPLSTCKLSKQPTAPGAQSAKPKPHKPTNRYPNALCTQHRYMWCMFQNPTNNTSQATTTMTSSSSSMTMAMCLLALCLAFTCVGSAAAAMSIPAVSGFSHIQRVAHIAYIDRAGIWVY